MKHLVILLFSIQNIFLQNLKIDTLKSEVIYENVKFLKFRLNDLHNISLVEFKLSEKLKIESYRPNNLETISNQIKDSKNEVITAINGGFFSFENGWPINPQVSNAIPILLNATEKFQFIISENNKPKFEELNFVNELIFSDTTISQIIINGNKVRKSISFHNHFSNFGRVDSNCAVYFLKNINKTNFLNDTINFLFSDSSKYFLSVPIEKIDFVNKRLSDTLKIIIKTIPNIDSITNIITGAGILLRNGISDSTIWFEKEKLSSTFVNTTHPRSIIAYNNKTENYYFIVVDGRQISSTGIDFYTLIDFLKFFKITDALNLDGGGSSTLIVNNKLVNSPSDLSGERKVANSLMLVIRNN